MRNRWAYFRPVVDYLGLLAWVFGFLMLVPVGVWAAMASSESREVSFEAFGLPCLLSLVAGIVLKRNLRFPPLDARRAMILCSLGWILISAIGAIPFCLGIGASYLDAYFETVSGFTTTGITMFSGLDDMPRSILFWRSFIQWLGGLGILTFFLAVLYTGGSAQRLFGAESHKVFSRRPTPSLFRTLRILWLIYAFFTALVTAGLVLEGMKCFDAVAHAMTALSTGGYSPYDASIEHFRQAGYRYSTLIEYTIILGMLLGGINFFVHYRVLLGGVKALWDSLEMRLWWVLLAGGTLLVAIGHIRRFGFDTVTAGSQLHEIFRNSLFQVVSIATTTGFATKDIAGSYFSPAAKQVFLVLMVVGGCVGSTGGGLKVLRVGVLGKMVGQQIRRVIYGPAAVQPVAVDLEPINKEEIRRIASLFFAWMALLAFGGIVTAMLSEHDAMASASGMFSALGNIGPCYIATPKMALLHPVVKVVYIFGMLAGRLEILPLLLLFSRKTWR